MWPRPALREALLYAGTLLLVAAALTLALQLWRADLSVPFALERDALYNAAVIKGGADNGTFLHNRFLGAPAGQDSHDHLGAYGLFYLALKGLLAVTGDWAATLNLFYLGGFLATALACLAALRGLSLSPASSVGASLLFTFLPYHFMRGEDHLFVGVYASVPLLAMLALWVLEDALLPAASAPPGPRRWLRPALGVGLCLAAASAGVYYAVFGALLLAVAGIAGALRARSRRPLLGALLLVGALATGLAANVAPTLLYHRAHGKTTAFQRSSAESELLGLKVSQLLLPASAHRVHLLQWTKARYNGSAPVTESDCASLGLVASCGFLLLLGLPFARLLGRGREGLAAAPRMAELSLLNLAALLVATVGGFSALLALWGTPQIRAYNRMSIFIAFFALAALAALWDALWTASPRGRRRLALGAGLAGVVLLGLWDQTSPGFVPRYEANGQRVSEQRGFIGEIGGLMAGEALIYQLPYLPYPEGGPRHRMNDYDHFAWGYLASDRLRWSYGAMKGRPGDAWLRDLSGRAPGALVESLALGGFEGLLVDRFGYAAPEAEALVSQLQAALGEPPLLSRTGRHAFFDLRPLRATLERSLGADGMRRRAVELNPVLVNWRTGFYGLESDGKRRWRWCRSEGEFDLVNPTSETRTVRLSAAFSNQNAGAAGLQIRGELLTDGFAIGEVARPYSAVLMIPPGAHRVRFSCDGPRVDAPRDPRSMVFLMEDFALTEVEAP